MGNHPPGKLLHFKGAGNKLCTMLRAHAAAYKAIKQMPGETTIMMSSHSCFNSHTEFNRRERVSCMLWKTLTTWHQTIKQMSGGLPQQTF